MADPTTSDPSSSASPAPSAPSPAPVSPAPAAASPSTPPSPVTTPSPTPPTDTPASPTLERPAWVPEKYWDATAKSVKGDELAAHYNELQARIAADDLRKAALPASPDVYKAELPKEFKVPEGIEFKINESDPILPRFKDIMHKIETGQLSGQQAFSEALGIYAEAQISSASAIESARLAQIAQVGPNATARVDAIVRYYDAKYGPGQGKAEAARLLTAADVTRKEQQIAKDMGSSASSYTGGSREPPPAAGVKTQAEIDKMSPGDRMAYAREQSARKSGRAA